jgi:hypothetical protein
MELAGALLDLCTVGVAARLSRRPPHHFDAFARVAREFV